MSRLLYTSLTGSIVNSILPSSNFSTRQVQSTPNIFSVKKVVPAFSFSFTIFHSGRILLRWAPAMLKPAGEMMSKLPVLPMWNRDRVSSRPDWFIISVMIFVSMTHCTNPSIQRAPATTRLEDRRADWYVSLPLIRSLSIPVYRGDCPELCSNLPSCDITPTLSR